MIEIVEAIRAMNTIQQYCGEQDEKCKGCIFDKDKFCYLMNESDPSAWSENELNKSNILEAKLNNWFAQQSDVDMIMKEVRKVYGEN